MAATALDNVIALRPSASPAAAAPAGRVLAECRDLAARRLREALHEMMEKLCEDLLQRGDVSSERDDRNFYYRLRDTLVANGSRLEAQLAAQWGREFDSTLKTSPSASKSSGLSLDKMELVDNDAVDEELALKAVTRRLQTKSEEELYALGRRMAVLTGREDSPDDGNPAAPQVLTRALQAALRDMDFDCRARTAVYRSIESCIAEHIGPIYHGLNAALLRHNILPNLRRTYGRSGGHTPGKEGSVGEGDMFSMLQKLMGGVGAAPASGPAPAAGTLPTGGIPAGFPGGFPAGGAMPAGAMPVGGGLPGQLSGQFADAAGAASTLPPQVWASLDAMQRAVPVFVAGQVATGGEAGVNTNLLREFKASEAAQGLGQLDAITVDIVAMLFDMIFDDREISDPIKALVGKLQIPVLKVAMLDKNFFSSKSHPTRRLLDIISHAAMRWGKSVGHDDPIYLKIAEIIDRIHADFEQDTSLFDTLCDDLESFLNAHEDAADEQAAKAAILVVQREQEDLAAIAANNALRPWLEGSTLPRTVTELLGREWRELLRRTYLESGFGSEAWQALIKTAEELVDSIRIERTPQERQALARQLPQLVKGISQGFDRLQVDNDRRHVVFDSLFSLHAAVLRGTEPPAALIAPPEPVEAKPEEAEPEFASDELTHEDVTVEAVTVVMPTPTICTTHAVEDLQRGDWVEFRQPDGTSKRYRLSWVSPERGILLFTNPQTPRALAVSPEAMSLQLQRGEAVVVPTEPIFDRAMSRAIGALQAA